MLPFLCIPVSLSLAQFGMGSGKIWFDNMTCTGRENKLIDCPAANIRGRYKCDHHSSAGVKCRAPIGMT